jgi:hypothetical protein
MEHVAHPSLAAQDDGAPDVLVRNVIAALRRALAERPEGCLEARLWHGVEACGVARRVFDEAIEIMLTAGWCSRRHGRLLSGAPPIGEPRLAIRSTRLNRRASAGWLW